MANEARKLVWMGAIPLQLHLHHSEVTTLPPPSSFMVLAPRNGYLPLLTPVIKPYFQSSLPPNSDTVWFDYQGLPLKWHIPTGVLFDLLCAEPERPWNLTYMLQVHFRSYPSDVLIPCDGEDAVKWNYMNCLKEASYIMYGNTRGIMNMSQSDQLELWHSVVNGDQESYDRVSIKLRPSSGSSSAGASAKGFLHKGAIGETTVENAIIKTGKIPFRLYIRPVKGDITDILDVLPAENWNDIIYITRPVEIFRVDGSVLTLWEALNKMVPKLFSVESSVESENAQRLCTPGISMYPDSGKSQLVIIDSSAQNSLDTEIDNANSVSPCLTQEKPDSRSLKNHNQQSRITINETNMVHGDTVQLKDKCQHLKGILRIQGIEPSLDLPLSWIMHNLCAPEQFVHVSICIWDADSFTKGSEAL
eukprot:c23996_g1_i3 orf=182-1435(-)